MTPIQKTKIFRKASKISAIRKHFALSMFIAMDSKTGFKSSSTTKCPQGQITSQINNQTASSNSIHPALIQQYIDSVRWCCRDGHFTPQDHSQRSNCILSTSFPAFVPISSLNFSTAQIVQARISTSSSVPEGNSFLPSTIVASDGLYVSTPNCLKTAGTIQSAKIVIEPMS